jgi:hypothetical protein
VEKTRLKNLSWVQTPSSFRRIFAPFNPCKLFYQCKQARRQRIGLPIQSLTKPFTDFLTDRAAMNAVDLNIILLNGIWHHPSKTTIVSNCSDTTTYVCDGFLAPSPAPRSSGSTARRLGADNVTRIWRPSGRGHQTGSGSNILFMAAAGSHLLETFAALTIKQEAPFVVLRTTTEKTWSSRQ